jgi:hypothetical protein
MMEHDLQELQDAQDEIGWDQFMFRNISIGAVLLRKR